MRKKNNLKPTKKTKLSLIKGGYSEEYLKYLEVLKKYYYIFGYFTNPITGSKTYLFDIILNSDIFKNSNHIDTLIRYLNEKSTSKSLENASQITEILIPALDEFIDKVLKK